MQSLQAKVDSEVNSNSSEDIETKAFTLVLISTMHQNEKNFKKW